MKRHRVQADVDAFVKFEKQGQPLVNRFYKSHGFTVNRRRACIEYDCVISNDRGSLTVEEKYRQVDYGDLLVELEQASEVGEKGWFYKCRAQRLVYIILSGNRIKRLYWIDWPRLRAWLLDNWNHPAFVFGESSRGIGITKFMTVYWNIIPRELYGIHPRPKDKT